MREKANLVTPIEHIQSLMVEIGPYMEPVEYVKQSGEAIWQIGVKVTDEIVTPLHVEYSDLARKLSIEAELSEPNPEQLQSIYEAMLGFNAMWRETGGVHLAMSGPEGVVTLVFDLFAIDLDVHTLASVIENMVVKVHQWREILRDGVAVADEIAPAQALEASGDASEFVRV